MLPSPHLQFAQLQNESLGDAEDPWDSHTGGPGSCVGACLLLWGCTRPTMQGDGGLPGRGGKELKEKGFLFPLVLLTAHPDST